jgi:hypothetical protein
MRRLVSDKKDMDGETTFLHCGLMFCTFFFKKQVSLMISGTHFNFRNFDQVLQFITKNETSYYQ